MSCEKWNSDKTGVAFCKLSVTTEWRLGDTTTMVSLVRVYLCQGGFWWMCIEAHERIETTLRPAMKFLQDTCTTYTLTLNAIQMCPRIKKRTDFCIYRPSNRALFR